MFQYTLCYGDRKHEDLHCVFGYKSLEQAFNTANMYEKQEDNFTKIYTTKNLPVDHLKQYIKSNNSGYVSFTTLAQPKINNKHDNCYSDNAKCIKPYTSFGKTTLPDWLHTDY
jgi:hypothetical protein